MKKLFVCIFILSFIFLSSSEKSKEVKAIVKAIEEINYPLSLSDKENLEIIRFLYEKLDEDEQSKVTNIKILEDAEEKIVKMIKDEEEKKKAYQIESLIELLDEDSFLEVKDKTEEIMKLYCELENKSLVSNYKKLENIYQKILLQEKIQGTTIKVEAIDISFMATEVLKYHVEGELKNEKVLIIVDEEYFVLSLNKITAIKEGQTTIYFVLENYPQVKKDIVVTIKE